MPYSPLTYARTRAGLSRRELAALAGVPQSTVARIERGQVSPSIDTVNRILAPVGQRLDWSVTSTMVDMSAAEAARTAIGGGTEPVSREAARWSAMWRTAGLLADDGRARDVGLIARLAALNTKLLARPGRIDAAPMSADAAAKILEANTIDYAVTGSAAANAIVPSGSEPWTVVYVDRPADIAGLFGPVTLAGQRLSLLPMDAITGVGRWRDPAGTTYADPIQVMIDCYAGVDRMPEQADALVEHLAGAASA